MVNVHDEHRRVCGTRNAVQDSSGSFGVQLCFIWVLCYVGKDYLEGHNLLQASS